MKSITKLISRALCGALALAILGSNALAGEVVPLPRVYSEITAPEGYTALTQDNLEQHKEYITETLKSTVAVMQEYFGMMYMYCEMHSPDERTLIGLSVYGIEGNTVFDLREAKPEAAEYIKESIGNQFNCKSIDVVEDERAKFVRAEYTFKNTNEEGITYATIRNGANFALTLSKPKGESITAADREAFDVAFKSLKFTEDLPNPKTQNWLTIVLIAVIALVAFGIGFVVLNKMNGWGDKRKALRDKMRNRKS
ncbi:MAG: hypothetical protein LBS74_08975 [Oscillospiraceae bacterium]|nr:hypothetical protein [Oscillospiraceae bacterium]